MAAAGPMTAIFPPAPLPRSAASTAPYIEGVVSSGSSATASFLDALPDWQQKKHTIASATVKIMTDSATIISASFVNTVDVGRWVGGNVGGIGGKDGKRVGIAVGMNEGASVEGCKVGFVVVGYRVGSKDGENDDGSEVAEKVGSED